MVSHTQINSGQLHCSCTLNATQVQALFFSVFYSRSMTLSAPRSPSLTATLQIHYLRELQTNLVLSHSPHTHTLTTPPQA